MPNPRTCVSLLGGAFSLINFVIGFVGKGCPALFYVAGAFSLLATVVIVLAYRTGWEEIHPLLPEGMDGREKGAKLMQKFAIALAVLSIIFCVIGAVADC